MVASSQPLAVSAGLKALQDGGTFVDAAIAVSSVLAVTEPFSSHLGGDAFVIVYEAATGKTVAYNASGAAPANATLASFPHGIPNRGICAASVPGLVDCWFELHERYGSIPVARILAPAIEYARSGFPAGYRHTRVFRDNVNLLNEHPETNSALNGNCNQSSIHPGRNIVQTDLAWSLEQIAKNGRSAFYQGAITDRMLEYSSSHGGLFSAGDFAEHHTDIIDPIQTDYRGYTIHGQPPVSQGHILLQQLNIVEGFDMPAYGHNCADAIHLQVEAKKRAFADRHAYLGDPAFVDVPMQTLLSKSYATKRRAEISLQHASESVAPGSIDHDTTYFCVIDSAGNAVSFIQSIFWVFGSAAVAPGTGILFNNRMTGFSPDSGSPNVLAPGKRTAHTLNAYLITRSESESARRKLAFVGGTPGGDIQVQSNLQVVCNVIDYGMNPQEAVEAPRWQHGGSVGAPGEAGAELLAIEDRVSPAVRQELADRGHHVAALGPWAHGSSYQLIAVDPETGAYMAGSDPRCDGHAAGF
jgi:gamma-glutamyltranspeptidase/glutathione hydrolase